MFKSLVQHILRKGKTEEEESITLLKRPRDAIIDMIIGRRLLKIDVLRRYHRFHGVGSATSRQTQNSSSVRPQEQREGSSDMSVTELSTQQYILIGTGRPRLPCS
jgi:hypothetical protein